MTMPKTFQEMLNNMLPPKVVDGVTYVPRLSWDGSNTQTFNAPRSGRAHGGIDAIYGILDKDGTVKYVNTTQAVNKNVLIGAPVDGTLRIIQENSNSPVKIAVIVAANGDEYVVRHMDNLPEALSGTRIQAGTVIGTMSNSGTVAVHDHLSIYSKAEIDGKTQRVALDPYTLYNNNFDLDKTDKILLLKQNDGNYSTVGGYRPSELVNSEERSPFDDKNRYLYSGADLAPHSIGRAHAYPMLGR
jgi:hypothetical protein